MLNEVIRRPSVDSFSATFLTLFLLTVIWISSNFAPSSADINNSSLQTEKVIPVAWGSLAYVLVLVVCGAKALSGLFYTQRITTHTNSKYQNIERYLTLPFSLLSAIWSFVDWLLVRVFSTLIGSGIDNDYGRYSVLVLFSIGSIAIAENFDGSVPIFTLSFLILCLIGVLRRWSWVERDREVFLLERGARSDQSIFRVGFKNDLRDETLIAIALIMLTIPVTFEVVQVWTCSHHDSGCAFETSTSSSWMSSKTKWIGFFGAELVKTLPFVDWSEVFNVANGSPIVIRTSFGAQFLFWVRASLDILFIASILQVFQLGARNREQLNAFYAGRLQVLEPFAEKKEFTKAARHFYTGFSVPTSQVNAVKNFPPYERYRLSEIIKNVENRWDDQARILAASVLQKQYPDQDTGKFFTEFTAKLSGTKQNLKVPLQTIAAGLPLKTELSIEDGKSIASKVKNNSYVDIDHENALISLIHSCYQNNTVVELENLYRNETIPLTTRVTCLAATSNISKKMDSRLLRQLVRDGYLEQNLDLTRAYISLGYAGRMVEPKLEDLHFLPHQLQKAISFGTNLLKEQRAFGSSDSRLEGHIPIARILIDKESKDNVFTMGASENDDLAYQAEHPQHKVKLLHGFSISRTAITATEFQAYNNHLPEVNGKQSQYRDLPVIGITWYEAQSFCRWLTLVSGLPVRLPSEAEWEFSCRAGTQTRFPWGEDWNSSMGNCEDETKSGLCPVNKYPPNDFGLYGMNGNNYEWCADPWHPTYEKKPECYGLPWISDGEFEHKVVRGGSWDYGAQDARSSYRYRTFAENDTDIMGFRISIG